MISDVINIDITKNKSFFVSAEGFCYLDKIIFTLSKVWHDGLIYKIKKDTPQLLKSYLEHGYFLVKYGNAQKYNKFNLSLSISSIIKFTRKRSRICFSLPIYNRLTANQCHWLQTILLRWHPATIQTSLLRSYKIIYTKSKRNWWSYDVLRANSSKSNWS